MLRDEDAEDAAQEAMIRAWRMRHTCRSPHDAAGWFAQIGRNEALRALPRTRRAVSELSEPGDAELSALDGGLEALPDVVAVRHALGMLSRSDRGLVTMRYERDMTTRQIAAVTGIPEGTVKVRLHRLRARLREVLDTDA